MARKLYYQQPTEHSEQAALFDLLDSHMGKYPELFLAHANINGIFIPAPPRIRFAIINKMKAEGMRPGVSDLTIPTGHDGYLGLYVELKRADGGKGASEGQIEFMAGLTVEGYLPLLCNGCDEAWEMIGDYLQQPKTIDLIELAALAVKAGDAAGALKILNDMLKKHNREVTE